MGTSVLVIDVRGLKMQNLAQKEIKKRRNEKI